jgi:hypothetical protein
VTGRRLGRLSAALPPAVLRTLRARRLRSLARGLSNADLIYSNTLQNGALLRELWTPRQKVVSHVHELEWWLRYRTPPEDLSFTKQVTGH